MTQDPDFNSIRAAFFLEWQLYPIHLHLRDMSLKVTYVDTNMMNIMKQKALISTYLV